MTKSVDTAFERHFSEPPVVAVKEGRTHCEACKESLDPSVMHKCHGNREYQAAESHTEITEKCPDCGSDGVLGKIERIIGAVQTMFVLVCKDCRTFVHPEVTTAADAILGWNKAIIWQRKTGSLVEWVKWLADLPGDDERANVIPNESKPARHPDLTTYRGACPAVHIEGHECPMCEGTGTVPPTKPEGAQ